GADRLGDGAARSGLRGERASLELAVLGRWRGDFAPRGPRLPSHIHFGGHGTPCSASLKASIIAIAIRRSRALITPWNQAIPNLSSFAIPRRTTKARGGFCGRGIAHSTRPMSPRRSE